jgi:hypothetical protein
MITYRKNAEWMGLIRRNSHWCIGSLQVSSPRWHYARGLCEVVRTGGSGEVAQAAREFGSAGFGRVRTALGEIVSAGFEIEEAMQKNLVRCLVLRREHRTALYHGQCIELAIDTLLEGVQTLRRHCEACLHHSNFTRLHWLSDRLLERRLTSVN